MLWVYILHIMFVSASSSQQLELLEARARELQATLLDLSSRLAQAQESVAQLVAQAATARAVPQDSPRVEKASVVEAPPSSLLILHARPPAATPTAQPRPAGATGAAASPAANGFLPAEVRPTGNILFAPATPPANGLPLHVDSAQQALPAQQGAPAPADSARPAVRAVIDAFTVAGEFDMLEVRLRAHWDAVDVFLAVVGVASPATNVA